MIGFATAHYFRRRYTRLPRPVNSLDFLTGDTGGAAGGWAGTGRGTAASLVEYLGVGLARFGPSRGGCAVGAIGCLFQFARQFLHSLAHDLPSFEFDRCPRRNDETASGLIGVATYPRLG